MGIQKLCEHGSHVLLQQKALAMPRPRRRNEILQFNSNVRRAVQLSLSSVISAVLYRSPYHVEAFRTRKAKPSDPPPVPTQSRRP